ncbi:MAG: hypothetical protein ACXACY_19280 [Candidatus Hodarchaeales archaeon]|jgi:hypothetical protein
MTNFQKYILTAIDSEGYNRDTETTEKKLKFVFDCFGSEFLHANNVKQFHRDNAKVFGEWIAGLPSTMNIAFYNYEILNLAYLFDLLPVDVTEEEEDEFLNGWFKLVASEFFVMYNELKY